MGKKRKLGQQAEVAEAAAPEEVSAPQRPKRTLLGWKDGADGAVEENSSSGGGGGPVFRNKEKVLVTCSRRIMSR